MKTAIVCEGGGMRGSYTAGVLQAFMDKQFIADALIGVSAGASNGVSYVSAQNGRGYRTNIDYCGDPRYVSFSNYMKTRSVFGMDFIFGEIPERLDPFDYSAFYNSKCEFYAGATDVSSGKAVFFPKSDLTPGYTVLRASCSMPVFSPIVEYKGKKYLDGGVAAPIPIQQAVDLGFDKLVVVLTQSRDYRKKPQSMRFVYHALYRRYPEFVKAMDRRHLVYNHTLQQLRSLEKSGKAIVVAPHTPLQVGRFGQDKQELITAYNTGYQDGVAAFENHLKTI